MNSIGFWEVSGTFLIPGTRERGSFGPVKVIAASKQQASADLVPLLNEKFSKEMSNRSVPSHLAIRFTANWAMMNLRWVDKMRVKAPPPAVQA